MLDLRRGSIGWAFNYLRKELLTGLISDLNSFNQYELPEITCNQIQNSLKSFSEEFDTRPRKGWVGKPLNVLLDDFRFAYKNWNNIKGDDATAFSDRKMWLKELVRKRDKISRRLRKHQNILKLDTVDDAVYLNKVINSFEEIAERDPKTFQWVSRSVIRFKKKMQDPNTDNPIKV